MRVQGRRIEIHGTVQGVGLRPWVYRLARAEGIGGQVSNEAEGVIVEAFGSAAALDRFVRRLRATPPPAARIRSLASESIPGRATRRFVIGPTPPSSERPRVSIPADLATCPSCRAEIFDRRDRRHRYPFTNCTDCGPRFTITRAMPYDRPNTTMTAFAMCAECQREYDDPGDRRFHAQPNACPACGPRLRALARGGVAFDDVDPLRVAARALQDGLVVAVKGIGGFHLACDATSAVAVRRLRARKHRDEKPFAVMVRDLAAAERLATLDDAERGVARFGGAPDRPGAPPRRAAPPAQGRRSRRRSRSGKPLDRVDAAVHAAAPPPARRGRLPAGHDLGEPQRRADRVRRRGGAEPPRRIWPTSSSSTTATSSRAATTRWPASSRVRRSLLRRARGYVPRPVRVARVRSSSRCSAAARSSRTPSASGSATVPFSGPHVGDLDNLEALGAYEEAIARMERFLDVRPEIVAHDCIPTTCRRPTRCGGRSASPLRCSTTTRTWRAPWPSTASTDRCSVSPTTAPVSAPTARRGAARCCSSDPASFERLATFRADRAAGRRPGRSARCGGWPSPLLVDAFAVPTRRWIRSVRSHWSDERELSGVRRMIERNLNTPRGARRRSLLRRVGALVLGRAEARFEGQVAMALEPRRRRQRERRVPLRRWHDDRRRRRDRPARDRARRRARSARRGTGGRGSRRASTTPLVAATHAVIGEALHASGACRSCSPAAASRTLFCCERLLAGLAAEIRDPAAQVPPGDGGIALGQVVVADAMLRAGTVGASGARYVPRRAGPSRRRRRAGGHGRLLGRAARDPARRGRRAGGGRRLRAEPRRLRDPAHPGRGDRRDPGALRGAVARAPRPRI